MRIVIKTILIIATLWIGGTILAIMKAAGAGALPLVIVGVGMIAGIKAIWNYQPSTTNDISLKKDD